MSCSASKRKRNRAAKVSVLTLINLYKTKHKQNRQLVVASVHRQQDILRSAKLAEAETVDKLRQQEERRWITLWATCDVLPSPLKLRRWLL